MKFMKVVVCVFILLTKLSINANPLTHEEISNNFFLYENENSISSFHDKARNLQQKSINMTIMDGWPDIINCSKEGTIYFSYTDGFYYLDEKQTIANLEVRYKQMDTFNPHSTLVFDLKGSFFGIRGLIDKTNICNNKSITQLNQMGLTYNMVSSKTLDNSALTSFFPRFPDAINCGSNNYPTAIFYLSYYSELKGAIYYQLATVNFQLNPKNPNRSVTFLADGTFNKFGTIDGTFAKAGTSDEPLNGCFQQSISNLYKSGRAFNLKNSNKPSTSSSLIPNWPDVIKCGGLSASDNSQQHIILFLTQKLKSKTYNKGPNAVVFNYHQFYFDDQKFRYISFSGEDGSYLESQNLDSSLISNCISKSIQSLYASDQAFNIFSQAGSVQQTFSSTTSSPPSSTSTTSSANTNTPTTNQNSTPSTSMINSSGGDLKNPTTGTTSISIPNNNNDNNISNASGSNTIYSSCLKLKSMTLSSVGDLDRNNEEIEFEITNSNKNSQFSCGLYLFDIQKNIKNKKLDINIPCNSGDYVDLRVIERDVCNDDMTLKKLECNVTGGTMQMTIQISPDNTATSYSQCINTSNSFNPCVSLQLGIVGGSFCYAYAWGNDECGQQQVAETMSEYILTYEITNERCQTNISTSSDKSSEKCINDYYRPGPICKTSETANANPNPIYKPIKLNSFYLSFKSFWFGAILVCLFLLF